MNPHLSPRAFAEIEGLVQNRADFTTYTYGRFCHILVISPAYVVVANSENTVSGRAIPLIWLRVDRKKPRQNETISNGKFRIVYMPI